MQNSIDIELEILKAQNAIKHADAVLILAGAGISVDSGLPDFRGNEGFWKAYPVAKQKHLSFQDLANPEWFHCDPALAWAFYGHRLHLYRDTIPHEGFGLLKKLCDTKEDFFIVTSNVDGQFQKAGFNVEKIYEIHGSIHHLQCTNKKSHGIWSAEDINVKIDMETFKAESPLPVCPTCKQTARPNILMFNDWDWIAKRSHQQSIKFSEFKKNIKNKSLKLVIIEIGAGTAIPSIRIISQNTSNEFSASIVRINPREYSGKSSVISIPFGALEGIKLLM